MRAPIARKMGVGALWLVTARLLTRFLDLGVLMALSRILGATDFGIIAIAMSVIVIVEASFDLPVIQALVSLEETSQADLDTAFTLALLRGLALALVTGMLAWPIAAVYGDPRLSTLLLFLAIAPLARGLYSPGMAVLNKSVNFRTDFIIEISGKAVSSLVAVAIALYFRSYWALAAATIVNPLCSCILSYALAPYRPKLSLSSWSRFHFFLGWSSASAIVSAVNWQCDRLLLGFFLPKAELGRFSVANDLSYLPVQAIAVPLLRPLTAGFAAVRDDRDRLIRTYRHASDTLLLLGLPVLLALSEFAQGLVNFALGDRWQSAGPFLQWLALGTIPTLCTTAAGPLAMAMGRTDIMFRQHASELLVKLPLVLAGLYFAGIEGVIASRLGASLFLVAYTFVTVKRLTGVSPFAQLAASWRIWVSCAIMALAIAPFRPFVNQAQNLIDLLLAILPAMATAVFALAGALYMLWHLSGRPEGVEGSIFLALRRLRTAMLSRGKPAGVAEAPQ
jgi:O-antigen/teichoic acid export membrane protein